MLAVYNRNVFPELKVSGELIRTISDTPISLDVSVVMTGSTVHLTRTQSRRTAPFVTKRCPLPRHRPKS